MVDVFERIRRHATYANVVATIALVAAAGGGAYAAIGSGGEINGCYKKRGGSLRLVNAGAKCKGSEKAIAWNKQGPAGAAGTNGTNGANGTDGTNGTNGTNGAPGATVKAKATGSGSSAQANAFNPVPLTGNTWTQGAGNPNQIDIRIDWQAPAGSCSGAGAQLNIKLDGATAAVFTATIPKGSGSQSTTGQVHLFAPGANTPHTVTAEAADDCAGSEDATITSLKVDVTEFAAP